MGAPRTRAGPPLPSVERNPIKESVGREIRLLRRRLRALPALVNDDLARLTILAGEEIRQGEHLALAGLAIVDARDGFLTQQPAPAINFADHERIAGPVSFGIGWRHVANPEQAARRVRE